MNKEMNVFVYFCIAYGLVVPKINIELYGRIGLTIRAVCSFLFASASALAAACRFLAASSARALAAAMAAGSVVAKSFNDARQ
jgi:hypothetical protein